MPFIPNTDLDRKKMFERIGIKSFDELIANIPDELKFKKNLNLPDPISELEILQIFNQKMAGTKHASAAISFLGGGAYDHFVPAAVDQLLLRSEFYTAYTPYQAEVSQGTLQAIYEYQSMIAELMNMEVANASMYDGGSALAEAALMAASETRRKKILISQSVHPYYRQIVQTYCHGQSFKVKTIGLENGITSLAALKSNIDADTAAVIIEHPNFLGYLEEVVDISKLVHQNNSLLITSTDPISLGILQPPGAYDTDIATGEGQCLGNALNFGGPYLGIFASKMKYVRKMPGRIAGATVDTKGRRGYVLTFQAREQHIRRAKATSNICSNQALNALAATVYLALLGKQGIQKVASLCLQNSHYLAQQIAEIKGYELCFDRPFFKEFVISTPIAPKSIIDQLNKLNIFPGIDLAPFDYDLKNHLLIAVTEKRSKEEMDFFVESLRDLLQR